MSIDGSNRVEQILDEQRAKRPRWYKSAAKSTPSWFGGGELDLLDASDRDKLFLEVSAGNEPSWLVVFILMAANLPNMIKGISSNHHRVLWISVAVGFVLSAVGASLARRRRLLVTARKRVRESTSWPLMAR